VVFVLIGPQGFYEPENTVLNFFMILGIPIYFFVFHFFPYLIAGGIASCLKKDNVFLSLITFLFTSVIASIIAEMFYTFVMVDSISGYSIEDYGLMMIFELCYIISFLFLANKFLRKRKN